MTSDDQTRWPQAHRLRLLWPFFYARESVAPATAALTALTHTARKTWPCWSTAGAVPTLYRDETLPHLRDFLFGTGAGGGAYLCVPEETANTWFKNGVVCAPGAAQSRPKDAARPREFTVRLAAPGIELFLSPHGVGVLSVTLAPAEGPTDLVVIQDFNYRLAQGRPFTAWHLRLPHGERHPEPPPAATAPLTERLGHPGGTFQLFEWVKFLLGPLAGGLDYQPVQEQFAVYSVTRFGTWADLADPAVAAALHPFLTALAHVEEGGHPGSLAVTAQTFNPRHWAAVGSLGTAHLIADQDPARDFDAQRLPTVLHKYFIPYLVGLLQRVALHRLLGEARAACAEAPGTGADLAARLGCLHRHALHLTVNGTFTEVSSREVLNQYYALTRTGLRVADSLGTLQRALRDAKAQDNDRFQGEALGELRALATEAGHHARLVAHVQSKVEWLEVFFVSYYFTALMYYVNHGESLFSPDYSVWTLIAAPVVSGAIAFSGLKPHRLRHHAKAPDPAAAAPPEGQPWGFLVWLVAAFVLWLAVGFKLFPAEAAGHAVQAAPAAMTGPVAAPAGH